MIFKKMIIFYSIFLIIIFLITESFFLIRVKFRFNNKKSTSKEHFSTFVLILTSIEWFYSFFDYLFLKITLLSFEPFILTILTYVGIICFITGEIIRIKSFYDLGEFYDVVLTLKNNHKLINNGLYQYIRHPLYLGSFLLFFGFPLVLHSYGGLIIFFAFVVPAFTYRIFVEEKMLSEYFKDKYLAYKKSTGTIFPKIRRIK